MPYVRVGSRDRGDPSSSPLVHAAERLVTRIGALAAEVEQLRAENSSLRAEVKAAVALINSAAASARPAPVNGRRRGAQAAATEKPKRRRRKVAKGRATPASVTPEVVRAVLAKLDSATASEIAGEITRAGAPVSGRAIRFLAERAGAQSTVGEDGQRRYRI